MRKTRAPRARPRQRAQKTGDYEVGYGKPPVHARFKPGQSGNSKGRPKGVRNFKMDVQTTLKAPVKVTRGGKPRNVSTQEAALLRLREKALGGDNRALDRLLAFAQAYNNEELAVTASLSVDDAMLLEIYRSRVLSGAAGTPDQSDENDGGDVDRTTSILECRLAAGFGHLHRQGVPDCVAR